MVPVDGKRLESHIFLNLSIGIYTPCEHRCVMESKCVSVNIGPTIENDKVTCELNDADHLQFPDDLKNHPGWTYRGTEVRNARNACCDYQCHESVRYQQIVTQRMSTTLCCITVVRHAINKWVVSYRINSVLCVFYGVNSWIKCSSRRVAFQLVESPVNSS